MGSTSTWANFLYKLLKAFTQFWIPQVSLRERERELEKVREWEKEWEWKKQWDQKFRETEKECERVRENKRVGDGKSKSGKEWE